MLTELKIQKFKGISSCDLRDIGRINLFIGKNDTGKSTILEAAYYLFRELYAPPQLHTIMSKRSDAFVGGSELWFNYDTDSEVVTTALFDEVRLDWRIELRPPGISSSLFGGRVQVIRLGETRYSKTFSMTTTSGGTMIGNIKESTEFRDRLANYASNMSFIDCTLKFRTKEIEGILARFKRVSSLESKFGEILDDIYGKGKDWQFIPQLENTDERRLAIKEAGQLKYFSGFGDGLRCCVGVIGTAMSNNNTAIFVEEIENHQHPEAIGKMVSNLSSIATTNNLQLFVTTHSRTVWNSFENEFKTDEARTKTLRVYLVTRDRDSGIVECVPQTKANANEFWTAVDEELYGKNK